MTGLSAINAMGGNRETIEAALRSGESGLGPSPLPLPFQTKVGRVDIELPPLHGPLAEYDTRLARLTRYLLEQLDEELRALRERWPAARIGVFLGTSTAGAATTETAFAEYLTFGRLPATYNYETQHTFGAILHVVRSLTGAAGPGWVVSTACTSSAKTVGSAARMIEADLIDAAIVGGVDTLCAMTLRGFGSLGALAEGSCRPFSTEATGINIGEGGAVALIERSGEGMVLVEGVGESSDAYHVSAPDPEGLGARLAMERALPPALAPRGVDHINAHGTGTTHNDRMESKAIRALFGAEVPVISTKGYTGHTLGGAGATELALAAWMMDARFIAPSVGADPVDPDLGIRVVTATESATIRRMLSNSFAFGGNNISLCLRAP